MLKHRSSVIESLLHRRGQMSTTAIVFLVLGDFNQPWTAANNQITFRIVVPGYLNPNVDPATFTVGGLGAAHYAGNSQLLKANENATISQITDGTSNTILAGEVSGGFMAWGDPENRRDPALGFGTAPNQFGGPAASRPGVMMLLCDGSVRFISNDVDPTELKNLADPKDRSGQAISF